MMTTDFSNYNTPVKQIIQFLTRSFSEYSVEKKTQKHRHQSPVNISEKTYLKHSVCQTVKYLLSFHTDAFGNNQILTSRVFFNVLNDEGVLESQTFKQPV